MATDATPDPQRQLHQIPPEIYAAQARASS